MPGWSGVVDAGAILGLRSPDELVEGATVVGTSSCLYFNAQKKAIVIMGYSKLIDFNSSKYRQRLDNLGIKLSELSKPKSIYYTEYTYSTIKKAFKTGKINPDLLHKLDLIVQYTSNPDKKNPTILNIVASDILIADLKNQNKILQRDLDEQNTKAIAEVKRLKEELRYLSTDLVKYSASFERASKYLKHVVNESCF